MISPPMREGRAAGSNEVMVRTPLRAVHSASQKAAFSRPMGLTMPRPVITTRREDEAMAHRGGETELTRRRGDKASFPPSPYHLITLSPCHLVTLSCRAVSQDFDQS